MALLSRAFFFFILMNLILLEHVKGEINVLRYGAKADGTTDNSQAFLDAWAATCNSIEPVTFLVPVGLFLVMPVVFSGPCRSPAVITVKILGSIVASMDYSLSNNNDNWIQSKKVKGLSVLGGSFDGRGTSLWDCKAQNRHCPAGATTLRFNNCEEVVVNGVKSVNPQLYHIVINGCTNVNIMGMKISAAGNSPNTDGIHVQKSTGVTIMSTSIKTGDDCISIGPGTQNLWIEKVFCGPGHGISIGSLGKGAVEDGVKNVTVKNTQFRGTQNGLRIKTWARPSTGFVNKVVFQNSTMPNVKNPIIITQMYCPRNESCPDADSGVKISGITFDKIQGTSASKVAVSLVCSPSTPCEDISLSNIQLSYLTKIPAQSCCLNAKGTSEGLMVPPSCLT